LRKSKNPKKAASPLLLEVPKVAYSGALRKY
jgi:hypothetical protein